MPVLEIAHVFKHFGGVTALSDVGFSVNAGERHALLGENGAGKSTLVKILSGEHQPDSGSIRLAGETFAPKSPGDARRAGVIIVPQELSYCPNLSVAENLLLGETPSRFGMVRRAEMRAEAERRLKRLELDTIPPAALMARLSTGQAQAVQIAGAIARHPKVLLLDEPTSALSRGEAAQLARILAQLKAEGVTVLYVSHRLEEIFGSADSGFSACDAYTVLRDGRHVETSALAGKRPDDVIKAMIGRELQHELLEHIGKQESTTEKRVRLKLEKFSDTRHGKFTDISLEVRAGEVLGLAGLVGAGRTELARALMGLDANAGGKAWIDGEPYAPQHVRAALARGLVYLTEDRKREGLVLNLSGTANWSLPFVGRFGKLGGALLRRGAERRDTAAAFSTLAVKTSSPDAPVRTLSGGNQQKILFARWLSVKPEPGVIILDEPTRGVDVGSKAEIHRLIAGLSLRGAAVVVISSDLPELLAVCTRLAVMRRGALSGILSRADMKEQAAGRLMVGVD